MDQENSDTDKKCDCGSDTHEGCFTSTGYEYTRPITGSKNKVEETVKEHKPTVAIDFDGVLHSYKSGWTGPIPQDPPVPGAADFVRWLQDQGWTVVVYSTRARESEGVAATNAWLEVHGFPKLHITSTKPPAVAYIDDRAVRFEGRWELIQRLFKDPEASYLDPWTDVKPLDAHGTWAHSESQEYYPIALTDDDPPELLYFETRAAAVAAAEDTYRPDQGFFTGCFREVDLNWLAEKITNWYCDQESVSEYISELLQECAGEAGEFYEPDEEEYRLLRDDIQAAFLRLLQRKKSRPMVYQVTDVEGHVVPEEE